VVMTCSLPVVGISITGTGMRFQREVPLAPRNQPFVLGDRVVHHPLTDQIGGTAVRAVQGKWGHSRLFVRESLDTSLSKNPWHARRMDPSSKKARKSSHP
jgi:hypothetical protein